VIGIVKKLGGQEKEQRGRITEDQSKKPSGKGGKAISREKEVGPSCRANKKRPSGCEPATINPNQAGVKSKTPPAPSQKRPENANP